MLALDTERTADQSANRVERGHCGDAITAEHWAAAVTIAETITTLGDGFAADRAIRVLLDLEETIEQQPIVTAEDAMLRIRVGCAMLERQMDADDPALLNIQAGLSFLRRT